MRAFMAVLAAWLAVAGLQGCVMLSRVVPSLAPEDASLEARRKIVRYNRARRKLFEPKKTIDPKTWPYEDGPPELPVEIGCLSDPLRRPKSKIAISSGYRDRHHSFEIMRGYHTGIDVPTPVGTDVVAPASGTVIDVHDAPVEDAWTVTVRFADGWAFRVVHLSAVKAKVGDVVRRGQVIGLSGGEVDDFGSGEITTGPHLHFDLIHRRAFVDPRPHFCEEPLKARP